MDMTIAKKKRRKKCTNDNRESISLEANEAVEKPFYRLF